METVKTVTFRVRSVYGNDLNYPACKNAVLFADLLGRKTLTARDIQYIKGLGFAVVYEYGVKVEPATG